MTKRKIDYIDIYKEFIENPKFMKLKNAIHHGLSRLEHVDRVARISFYISQKLNLDTISTVRGALLHDFFTNEDVSKKNYKDYLKNHPFIALKNSKKYFKVNDVEEDIICSHMYPLTRKFPKYKESYVVSISDKLASIYEYFRYKVKMQMAVGLLFLINIK